MTTTKPEPAPEAPKVEDWDDLCGCEPGTYCDNHKPAPAPEPKPCGICKGVGFYNTVYRDRIRCPNLCGDPSPILPTKAPEPQGSEESAPCLPSCQPPYHSMLCDNEGQEPVEVRLCAWAQNEEMIDSSYTQHGKDCLEANTLILALRAEVEELKARFAHDIDSRDHAYALLEAERKRIHDALAAALEEIAENGALCVKLAAEKARADRAEALVTELQQEIVSWRNAQAVNFLGEMGEREAAPRRRDAEIRLSAIADSILAARARKEGGSR